jgi:nucleoside-diphosphate-sugar epimerase
MHRMKVLVTGAAGNLGTRVVAQLSARHDVVALRRVGGDGFVECDLANTSAMAAIVDEHRPEAVVHLAWFAKHPAYWTSLENLASAAQSLELLRIAAGAGCRRFVGAGTCAEYDWSHVRLVEGVTPCVPRTLYGAAKLGVCLAGERMTAMSFAWARYGFLFGPGDGRLISTAIAALRAGEDFRSSAGEQVRDFLHLDDAASATVAILESDLVGPVNVGSGEATSVRAVVETIAALAGGAGRPQFGASSQEPPELVLDTSRLASIWRAPRTLRERLEEMVRA